MSRVPKQDLEGLKAAIDLAAVIGATVTLEKRGQDLAGKCPFHDDDTASLVVTPAKNLWHCFGCNAGGDVIAWTMKHERVSFRHAVELLKANAPPTSVKTAPKLPSPVEIGADAHDALAQVAGYYHATLKEHAEALAYLESRKLASTIERFQLGYANRTLGLRLPHKNRVAGEQLRGQLEQLGVYRASGHEHLAGSIVVPLFDEAGHVVGMYGRKVLQHLRAGTAKHLYLPGPHRGFFNAAAFSSPTLIVCEAIFDALSFIAAGIENVTSAYGVHGFTDEMLEIVKRCGVRHVHIAFDADEAGDTGADVLSQQLLDAGVATSRLVFPRDQDANDVWRRRDAREMQNIIDRALPMRTVPVPTKPPPAPAAQPLAAPVTVSNDTPTLDGDDVVFALGGRGYCVRGFALNASPLTMKVNVTARCKDASVIETIDVFVAAQRIAFETRLAKAFVVDVDVVRRDVEHMLGALSRMQQEKLKGIETPSSAPPPVSDDERRAALQVLTSKKLIDTIIEDFARCGVVGEETNKLVGYLAMTSRKIAQPLAVMVQSSSAAGKSSLMDAVLAFCPDEEKQTFSSMTAQSLYYMRRDALKHKVLAIAEEEGAKNASYPLKVMSSEGGLAIAAPSKNPATGLLETIPYRVDGPVMLFMTTTSVDIDEELMNRCLVLTVDEDRAQTRAIHNAQRRRRTLEGLRLSSERTAITVLHQNMQRLLRPLHVVNPWANELTFADDKTRMRRDNAKYLSLIDVTALLHQHQRTVRTVEHNGKALEYIEVTLEDIALANRLAAEVLGRSLDELPPQTRKMLRVLSALVDELAVKDGVARGDVRLTRRTIFQATGWSSGAARVHIERLVDVELLLAHRGENGVAFVYSLAFDESGTQGTRFTGLIDVEHLRSTPTTGTLRGETGHLAGTLRAPCGDLAGTLRTPVVDEERENSPETDKTAAKEAVVPYTYANGRAL